jgi:hypothetical protein
MAVEHLSSLDVDGLAASIATIRDPAVATGRDADALRIVVILAGSANEAAVVAGRVDALQQVGVTDVGVDAFSAEDSDVAGYVETLRAALSGAPTR